MKKPPSRNNYNGEERPRKSATQRKGAESRSSKALIIKSENALKQYNDQLEIEANRNNLAQNQRAVHENQPR